MRVIWTRTAARGIERAYDYLVDFNPRAAVQVMEGLREAGNSLVHFSHRGRRVPGTEMRELVTSYPYIIRYEIIGDAVVILRVRHTARRPTAP
jgi:addiction module RelE/StbE family toxin